MTQKSTQLVERTLIFAKVETTKGVDALPTKALDAFLVGSGDIQLDPTVLERDVQQASLSPQPGSVGRKVVNVTFNHEIKGSGANGVRPKLGVLLRGCAFTETQVTAGAANQIDTPYAYGSIIGPVPTWAKTTPPNQRYGSYLVTVVTGGASGAAKVQVTKHNQGDYDATVGNNRRIEAKTNWSALTTLTLNQTDLTSLTFTVAGTVTTGDQLYAVILGEVFRLVVTSAMTTPTLVAAALAALIDPDARFAAVGAAGVVTVTFTGNSLATTITTAVTAISLGDSGASITPTWTGTLVAGQQWLITLKEVGYEYKPQSSQLLQDSLTIYFFKDGNLHIVTGCQGTVTFTGEAGNYASAQFEFNGIWQTPVNEPLPTGVVFEQSLPSQLELAQMSIKGDKDFCAQSFTIALGNEVTPRDCMNGIDGLNGANITARAPTWQLNPESSIEVYTGMWGAFGSGDVVPLHLRVGTVKNNVVRFWSDAASYTGLNYGDRNGTVTQEPSFQLNGVTADGDDELRISFPQAA